MKSMTKDFMTKSFPSFPFVRSFLVVTSPKTATASTRHCFSLQLLSAAFSPSPPSFSSCSHVSFPPSSAFGFFSSDKSFVCASRSNERGELTTQQTSIAGRIRHRQRLGDSPLPTTMTRRNPKASSFSDNTTSFSPSSSDSNRDQGSSASSSSNLLMNHWSAQPGSWGGPCDNNSNGQLKRFPRIGGVGKFCCCFFSSQWVHDEQKTNFDIPSSEGCHHFFQQMDQKSKQNKKQKGIQKVERTYYSVLNVKKTADEVTIRKAYLDLAKKFHPDQNPDNPEASVRFQEVQEAYSVLRSKWKRSLYDRDLSFGQNDSVGLTVDEWNERWKAESEEEKAARRERYRRYAEGTREDIPPDSISNLRIYCYVGGIIIAVIACCYIAPSIYDEDNEPNFTDIDVEEYNRSVPLVRAFHNPIANRWEQLPDDYEPPSPYALLRFYEREYPKFRADKANLPRSGLTVLNVRWKKSAADQDSTSED